MLRIQECANRAEFPFLSLQHNDHTFRVCRDRKVGDWLNYPHLRQRSLSMGDFLL